jgi:hypothetical protein
MPLDVMNIVASQVILSNATTPPDPETTARVSVAAGLVPGPIGLVLPILAGRQAAEDGGGQEGIIVPDVEGKSREAATAELEGSRLKVTVQKAFSTKAESGIVVRQSPAAGSVRPLNSTVTIIVSDGPPPENGEDDGGDAVTRAEFEAGMKSLNDKLDQLIKVHGGSTGSTTTTGGSTGSSSSTTPAASSSSTTSTPRSRTT